MSSTRRPARRARHPRRLLVLGLVVVAVAGAIVWFVGRSSPSTGYDISSPQCGAAYPASPQFGIVGVNAGLANNANPCLEDQLRWALAAPGQKSPAQPAVSFYLVTANPGAHHVADWPSSGTTPMYGSCNGLLTNACSYIYGEDRARQSYHLASNFDPSTASTVPWWLDVELGSSWAGTYALNIAALRGFIAGLRGNGVLAPVGIYSTSAQWKDITGLTAQTTQAAFHQPLLDWVAGAETATRDDARKACASGGFTGIAPTLAQYRDGAFDADLLCAAAG